MRKFVKFDPGETMTVSSYRSDGYNIVALDVDNPQLISVITKVVVPGTIVDCVHCQFAFRTLKSIMQDTTYMSTDRIYSYISDNERDSIRKAIAAGRDAFYFSNYDDFIRNVFFGSRK